MLSIPVVIVTNSAYSYLWPVINDLTKDFNKVFICGNDFQDFEFNKNITKVFYAQTDSYTKRVSSVIKQIDSDYLLFLHDVDLIINLNQDTFKSYLNLMIKNNVDRLSLGVFNNKEESIISNDLAITRLSNFGMSKNFFTPFDYAPSIYKKNSLLKLYSIFDESYQNFELRDDVQNFALTNLKCYGVQKLNDGNIIYHRGFAFIKDMSFLHLTVKGKLLPLNLYYDLECYVKTILEKYKLLNYCQFHNMNYNVHKNEIT
jgi:hypothetical protein